jgi:hypothetical protein
MFTLWGAPRRFCDRIDRRDFLRIGALGFGGLALPDLLRLRAQAGTKTTPKSIIMVCLAGGPSHLETYDLKPNAPDDFRGEYKPIRTNVPGFDICEHFPLQSRIADKLAVVRTLQFVEPMQHELEEVYTGFPKAFKRPSFGAVVSRARGTGKLPAYVSLDYGSSTANYESPQYLGAAHSPLQLAGNEGVRNLSLQQGMTRARLDDRRGLMQSFDTFRRDMDVRRETQNADTFTSQAFDIITSDKARQAFDLAQEPAKVLERYGGKDDTFRYVGNNLRWDGQRFLLARRLVEAGVGVVTLRVGNWDHHGNVVATANETIWGNMKTALPLLDRSVYALVTDLHERGLDKDVMVLVWGEFGRTPKISQAGRDHWPDCGFALFAGGGLKTGQVIGETDSKGALPRSRPLGPQNVLATIYQGLGVDPTENLFDFNNRPVPVLDDPRPISELF